VYRVVDKAINGLHTGGYQKFGTPVAIGSDERFCSPSAADALRTACGKWRVCPLQWAPVSARRVRADESSPNRGDTATRE
jgi:hypothetical protein